MQALTPNKPGQAGVGGRGIALASDGSIALLSGSPATSSRPANAYLYSFYTTAGQYNACPQEIRVRSFQSPFLGFYYQPSKPSAAQLLDI